MFNFARHEKLYLQDEWVKALRVGSNIALCQWNIDLLSSNKYDFLTGVMAAEYSALPVTF